jgi:hypothetical protein
MEGRLWQQQPHERATEVGEPIRWREWRVLGPFGRKAATEVDRFKEYRSGTMLPAVVLEVHKAVCSKLQ